MSSRNTRIYERGQVFSLWLRDHVVEHEDVEHRGTERTLVLDSLELVGSLLLAAVFPADSAEHFANAQRTLTRLRSELGCAARLGCISADVSLRAYSEIAAIDRMLRGQRANARAASVPIGSVGGASQSDSRANSVAHESTC